MVVFFGQVGDVWYSAHCSTKFNCSGPNEISSTSDGCADGEECVSDDFGGHCRCKPDHNRVNGVCERKYEAYFMSLVMIKPAFCICENKNADQFRGNREADQPHCFRYTDSTFSLLPKCKISSL